MPKIKNPLTVVQSGGESNSMFKALMEKTITEVKAEDFGNATKIWKFAFENCRNLTRVNLPNSITEIQQNAFSHCTILTEINIPNSVTVGLGATAFFNCGRLTKITVPNASVGCETFNGCKGLTMAMLGNGVSLIEYAGFINCNNLRTLVIEKKASIVSLQNVNAFTATHANLLIYVPLSLIESYKTATNWVSYESKLRPAVDTVTDLTNIDTTTYTEAWVYATEKAYTYDGSQWNEVT